MDKSQRHFTTTSAWNWNTISQVALSLVKSDAMLVVLVLFLALVGTLLSEKIQAGKGFGFDGSYYGSLAKSFSSTALLESNSYRLVRMLPSAVVHAILVVTGQPLTIPSVIAGFELLNVALLALGAFLWTRICRLSRINWSGKIVGMAGLFLCFGLTKWVWFYPVLTDVPAVTIAFGMLYAYLSNKRLLLFGLAVLGAVTWPTLLYQAALFLLLPRNSSLANSEKSPARDLNRWIGWASSALLLILTVWSVYDPPYLKWNHPLMLLLPASILVTLFIWYRGVTALIDDGRFYSPRFWLTQFNVSYLVPLILLMIGVALLQQLGVPSQLNNVHIIKNVLLASIQAPGIFLVADFFFMGPIVLLAAFRWRTAVSFLNRQGVALVLNALLGFFFVLDSETRVLLTFLPVFVLAIGGVVTLERNWRAGQTLLFVLLSLLVSRVWLPLNGMPGFLSWVNFIPVLQQWLDQNRFWSKPNRFYYISGGPWMLHEEYFALAALFILLTFGCHLFFLRGRRTGDI